MKATHARYKEIMDQDCTLLRLRGELTDEKTGVPWEVMLKPIRENTVFITRNGMQSEVFVKNVACCKVVEIEATEASTVSALLMLGLEIFRFENLFEGCFFPIMSCECDGEEHITDVKRFFLEYYLSGKRYACFLIKFKDQTYKYLFDNWCKLSEELDIIHQAFLFSTYLMTPVDLGMSLLLQVFEPIADKLDKEGTIEIGEPQPYFKDKLKAVIEKYGRDIFKGEDKCEIIRRAVKLRNRMFHIDLDAKNYMTGEQSGFYIYKFSMLYRYIILRMLGLDDAILHGKIIAYVAELNRRYPQCRIQ